MLLTCHDDASKFLQLLGSPGSRGLAQEDFVPFLQDVVNSHPGLSFLREASEFHSRYITTVSGHALGLTHTLGHAHSKTRPRSSRSLSGPCPY